MRARVTLLVVAGAAALALAAPATAGAATAIDGRCAMHIGRLVSRNQTGSQYLYRTGLQSNGWHCHGYIRIIHHSRVGNVGVLAWRSYNLTSWNENNVILITSAAVNVYGCNAAAKGVIAAIEAATLTGSDGLAAPATDLAVSITGCGLTSIELWRALPSGPRTVKGVREVK